MSENGIFMMNHLADDVGVLIIREMWLRATGFAGHADIVFRTSAWLGEPGRPTMFSGMSDEFAIATVNMVAQITVLTVFVVLNRRAFRRINRHLDAIEQTIESIKAVMSQRTS